MVTCCFMVLSAWHFANSNAICLSVLSIDQNFGWTTNQKYFTCPLHITTLSSTGRGLLPVTEWAHCQRQVAFFLLSAEYFSSFRDSKMAFCDFAVSGQISCIFFRFPETFFELSRLSAKSIPSPQYWNTLTFFK